MGRVCRAPREKPLHSLVGEYLKHLRDAGLIESQMSLPVLKSSILLLKAFNDVRNNRSLAHDNPILGYEEALLIFNHTAATVRFLRSVDCRLHATAQTTDAQAAADDIAF